MKRRREKEDDLHSPPCKIIEYLYPDMSNNLLRKFPDNSPLDFDYSQSAIWSPLVPRHHPPLLLDHSSTKKKKARLIDGSSGSKRKTLISKFRFFLRASESSSKHKYPRFKKLKSIDEPKPILGPCAIFSSTGFNGALKAASKHLKRRRKHPKGSPHPKLSNYLRFNGD